jgi:hypothetical protein
VGAFAQADRRATDNIRVAPRAGPRAFRVLSPRSGGDGVGRVIVLNREPRTSFIVARTMPFPQRPPHTGRRRVLARAIARSKEPHTRVSGGDVENLSDVSGGESFDFAEQRGVAVKRAQFVQNAMATIDLDLG